MTIKYYYSKRLWDSFGSLTQVTGKETKQLFIVTSAHPIFGAATWDVRIPKDTSYLFNDREEGVRFLKSELENQIAEAKEELNEAMEFLENGE